MKKIILGLVASLFLLACSADKAVEADVTPSLVVGQALELSLQDQFENAKGLETTTQKVLFAFSKDMAHICNDYFVTKDAAYLASNNTQFVADVSSAPSLIRSMFIMPGLKEFKHTVLLLDDKAVAAPFKAGVDAEKIIVVYVENGTITSMKNIATEEELIATIEAGTGLVEEVITAVETQVEAETTVAEETVATAETQVEAKTDVVEETITTTETQVEAVADAVVDVTNNAH